MQPSAAEGKSRHSKNIVLALVLSLIISAFTAVGYFCDASLNGARSTGTVLVLAVLTFMVSFVVLRALPRVALKAVDASDRAISRMLHRAPRRVLGLASRHRFAFYFLVISLCWLPYLIVFFPGVFMYDSTWELFQTLGSGSLYMGRPDDTISTELISDHKPVLHAFIVGMLFRIGSTLGSQTLGIFLITLVQFICMAASFAFALLYCHRLASSLTLQLLGLLFLGVFPLFPFYSISAFNDCLALCAFLMWLIFVIESVRTRGQVLADGKFFFGMIAFATLSVFLKKPNVYIVFASLIIIALVYRKHFIHYLVQALVPSVLCLVVAPTLIYPVLHISSGDKGEMLGMLFQQTTYYSLKHEDQLSSEDKATIDKVFNLEGAQSGYNPTTFDPVKYYYQRNATTSDIIDYLALWVRQGIHDPLGYFIAAAYVQYPYVYPSMAIDFYDAPYKDMSDAVAQGNRYSSQGKTDAVNELLDYAAPNTLAGIRSATFNALVSIETVPALLPLLSIAIYATWIPLTLLYLICSTRPKRRLLLGLIPIMLSILVLTISPVVMVRYAFPVIGAIPIMSALALSNADRNPRSKKSVLPNARH